MNREGSIHFCLSPALANICPVIPQAIGAEGGARLTFLSEIRRDPYARLLMRVKPTGCDGATDLCSRLQALSGEYY